MVFVIVLQIALEDIGREYSDYGRIYYNTEG
jgi:hypothetical protein